MVARHGGPFTAWGVRGGGAQSLGGALGADGCSSRQVGIGPLAVSSLGSVLGFASLLVVSSAPVITGIRYFHAVPQQGRF